MPRRGRPPKYEKTQMPDTQEMMIDRVHAWAESLGYKIIVHRTITSYITGNPQRYRLTIREPDGTTNRSEELTEREDTQYCKAVVWICHFIGKPGLARELVTPGSINNCLQNFNWAPTKERES